MTEKEVAELRRRFRADKSNITHVRGCYVNGNHEIISEFDQSITMLGQEEGEMLLAILRKTLSGALGKNLMDIEFSTQQVAAGEEHKRLMALRNSRLEDTNALHAFYAGQVRWGRQGERGHWSLKISCSAHAPPQPRPETCLLCSDSVTIFITQKEHL